jgi:hypothetical protein
MPAGISMTADIRRHLFLCTLAGLAIAAPLALQYFWPSDALHDVSTFPYGRDFINVWGGAHIAFQRDVMTLFDYKTYYTTLQDLFGSELPFHAWSYPPHLLVLIAPFAWTGYFAGLAIWSLLGFAIYAAVLLARLTPNARIWGLVVLALGPATLVNLVTGQNGFYTAALLLGAIAMFERRPWIAGILLGLLTVKPHLGIVIGVVLLSLGAWRTIAAALVTALLLVAITVALWGIDPWIGFFTKTMAITRFYFDHFEGFYTYMMPSVFASALLMGVPQTAAFIIQCVVSLAVIAVTIVAFRRTRDTSLRALLIASATLLASPYAFNYDMTLLAGALLWAMASMNTMKDYERWIFGLAWILPVLIWPMHLYRVGAAPLMIGAVFVATLSMIRARARADGPAPMTPLQASSPADPHSAAVAAG